MWTKRVQLWRFMLCAAFAAALVAAARESQCRPYIEKALKELESGDTETDSSEKHDSSEVSIDIDTKEADSAEDTGNTEDADSKENAPSVEVADEPYVAHASIEVERSNAENEQSEEAQADEPQDSKEEDKQDSNADSKETDDFEGDAATEEASTEQEAGEDADESDDKSEEAASSSEEQVKDDGGDDSHAQEDDEGSQEKAESEEKEESDDDKEQSKEDTTTEDKDESGNEEQSEEEPTAQDNETSEDSKEESDEEQAVEDTKEDDSDKSGEETNEVDKSGEEDTTEEEAVAEPVEKETAVESAADEDTQASVEGEQTSEEGEEASEDGEQASDNEKDDEETSETSEQTSQDEEGSPEAETVEKEEAAEEELLNVPEIPENLRSRDHISQILRLDEETSEAELTIEKSAEIVLRDIKKLYENSIKPLETLYKYRDLSNRHFGDPEIFSKPLVLFMGPWSGGKSSILNYLTGLEFTEWSLRTGAEPSPAYFNILMHGKDPEVLDGTQLAADWTFSGLQKFGQGLEERLRGLRHPSKILEKVNIVEIPGILEVRKQVSRVFPFNDACQWFIDRADIIFLVYDPSKLDVGPETEAILDQLKGRESQTRIVLNKADSVKPEELMRVQSALIWNISPLMSSAQPPVMYTVSLWSMPFEAGAPVRLLQAQERELLRDLRQAIDKRIENKISSARRFAVRVRNHAKMVDCYLTTYYNHKTIFGNKKLIADAIIENPQNYHIYEGLSTLTNISRYDLPDPETYRDFFRLNPLYEFQQLAATCTYFRGCPINRLDVAIAYDLPEIVGKYKKMVETSTPQGMPKS
ncbi:hypothetical protein MSG28_011876 [Choristoneura fumiferana]|uniref:Uncharacterized protein n=1 Tax=Choristoneura fumiferana TaxID=7141 RepID=A0ACC0KM59_CHOFU|nr:hypothetical protein MSG28_011876 [Choristoneura fumiferana]